MEHQHSHHSHHHCYQQLHNHNHSPSSTIWNTSTVITVITTCYQQLHNHTITLHQDHHHLSLDTASPLVHQSVITVITTVVSSYTTTITLPCCHHLEHQHSHTSSRNKRHLHHRCLRHNRLQPMRHRTQHHHLHQDHHHLSLDSMSRLHCSISTCTIIPVLETSVICIIVV